MIQKIYIDSDIILDSVLKRDPYYNASAQLFSLIETHKIQAFISPIIFSNIYYLIKKFHTHKKSITVLTKLRPLLEIIPVNEKIIDSALNSHFPDLEDAIQYYAAISHGIKTLITRNKKHYKSSSITICSAEEFLAMKKF